MAAGCRDCDRCTEFAMKSLVMLPFRFVYELLTVWNIGLFQRKCPQCRHRMAFHRKVGGRFMD